MSGTVSWRTCVSGVLHCVCLSVGIVNEYIDGKCTELTNGTFNFDSSFKLNNLPVRKFL